MRKKKNAFTLIELIAVLVIMAIIALIVTPLVMNIVKKAKDSANKRSVDAYGKAVELAVATHLLDTGDYPTSLDNLTVEYSGNEVVCNVKILNEDGSIYLSECSVKGTLVKDSSKEDGWYHYGKTSATAYQSYKIGDIITYNGTNFYVIEESDENSDRVTMLKSEPLTVDEVNTYGIDSNGESHINKYTSSSSGISNNINNTGYGGMAYYTSSTCGYINDNNVYTGCKTDYKSSDVKYVVDAWANDKLNMQELTEDKSGYKVRLLSLEDLVINLGYTTNTGSSYINFDATTSPAWIHIDNFYYWTMSLYGDSNYEVWAVGNDDIRNDSITNSNGFYYDGNGVRPVITLLKSAI